MKHINRILGLFIFGCVTVLTGACSDDDDKKGIIPEKTGNPVTNITLSNVTNNIAYIENIGESINIQVAISPTDASDKDEYYYEYISSNTNVFTVDNNGTLTGTGWGEATLNIIAKNNTSIATSCKVIVLGDILVESIEISENLKLIDMIHESGNPQYNLAANITIYPEDASVKTVNYTTSNDQVAIVDGDGKIQIQGGFGTAIIRVEALDRSGVYAETVIRISKYNYTFSDRSNWTAIDSSPIREITTNDFIAGGPEYVIDDDNLNTCVGLLKSGDSSGKIYFTIDMGEVKNFNYCFIEGIWAGTSLLNNAVKIKALSLYGSNDGTNFIAIQENMSVSTSAYEDLKRLETSHSYRYIKAVVTPNTTSTITSNYVIIRNFKLGNFEILIP